LEERQKPSQAEILTLKNLKVTFHTYVGDVKALDGINLSVERGEILGLVGESGCGKSVTALTIVGLLPPNAEVESGEVILDGNDLLIGKKEELRLSRLRNVAIVFQDPMTYLNPVLTIGSQITEIITTDPEVFTRTLVKERLSQIGRLEADGKSSRELLLEKRKLESALAKGKVGRRQLRRLAELYTESILKLVKLPEAEHIFKMYPFELSGGMRQRAMIAMALVRRPKVLLADEITTALDVTVQAQILKLLLELKKKIDSSIVIITHDLGIVAEVCDRIAVMYAGNIVEVAEVNELFRNPLHPYTVGLLAAVPRADVRSSVLTSISGTVPNLISPPTGCRFHPRCPRAFDRCSVAKPPPVEVTPGHLVECLLYGG
jgi:oligopeptide/dipeptide ABC transporter ATP-binding protein